MGREGEGINAWLSISSPCFSKTTALEKEPGLGHSKIQSLDPVGRALASLSPHAALILRHFPYQPSQMGLLTSLF